MPDPSTIAFEEHDGYVVCRYAGPFEFQALAEAVRALRAYCVDGGHAKVLVDVRASVGDLTVPDRYKLANDMSYNLPFDLRIAVWGRQEQSVSTRTWESAMVAHGFAAHTFTSLQAAIQWLFA